MKKFLIAGIAALSIAMSSGAVHASDNMNQGSIISQNSMGYDPGFSHHVKALSSFFLGL